jgi:biotin synthase
MTKNIYQDIIGMVESGTALPLHMTLRILDVADLDTFEVLQVAYHFRRKYFGKTVTAHILNNVQNGLCPEDCKYCAQSTSSKAPIEEYPMKSDQEIMEEARAAYQNGACRYCMVFSGTGPSQARIDHLCRLVREIKELYPIEVCVSPGVISREQARQLKEAGLDRLNHNLNTAPKHYGKICTTHAFADRLETLRVAKEAGLAVCSGIIIGMGETKEELVDVAMKFREIQAESIPVNFLIPIPGIALKEAHGLSPEYCLRVLCLFRLLNPSAEIRMAAGREMHLKALEPLGLYAANSLFLQGYLNAKGCADVRTLSMIRDMGFSIKSEIPLDTLLIPIDGSLPADQIKTIKELRPFQS